MTYPDKTELFVQGCSLLYEFCDKNSIQYPTINKIKKKDWYFSVCAYYRKDTINICVEKCTHIGTANRAWSYPGYVIDRTPYGVVAHELGHHIDLELGDDKGAYFSDFSSKMRAKTKEVKLTNYCPNDAEWFAEMFRLFVTNPDLLRLLRPKTFRAILDTGLQPRNDDTWDDVLFLSPERTYTMTEKKISMVPAK